MTNDEMAEAYDNRVAAATAILTNMTPSQRRVAIEKLGDYMVDSLGYNEMIELVRGLVYREASDMNIPDLVDYFTEDVVLDCLADAD